MGNATALRQHPDAPLTPEGRRASFGSYSSLC